MYSGQLKIEVWFPKPLFNIDVGFFCKAPRLVANLLARARRRSGYVDYSATVKIEREKLEKRQGQRCTSSSKFQVLSIFSSSISQTDIRHPIFLPQIFSSFVEPTYSKMVIFANLRAHLIDSKAYQSFQVLSSL